MSASCGGRLAVARPVALGNLRGRREAGRRKLAAQVLDDVTNPGIGRRGLLEIRAHPRSGIGKQDVVHEGDRGRRALDVEEDEVDARRGQAERH